MEEDRRNLRETMDHATRIVLNNDYMDTEEFRLMNAFMGVFLREVFQDVFFWSHSEVYMDEVADMMVDHIVIMSPMQIRNGVQECRIRGFDVSDSQIEFKFQMARGTGFMIGLYRSKMAPVPDRPPDVPSDDDGSDSEAETVAEVQHIEVIDVTAETIDLV